MRLAALILLAVIFFPGISPAISVDVWETGMSIDEVVSVAREHDIPIARSGLIIGSKRFDPKVINADFYKTSSAEYRTTIGENQASICLRFMDEPKLVYEIETKIYILKEKEAYTKELMDIMIRKHGAPRKRMDIFINGYEWRPDRESVIFMRTFGSEVIITYTDLRMKTTVEEQRRQKARDAVRKDAGKF